MTGGMWAGRLGIVIAIIIVAQASAALAYFLVAVSFVGAICYFVYKGSYLPRFIMDVLDRLTNKAALVKAHEKQTEKLTMINVRHDDLGLLDGSGRRGGRIGFGKSYDPGPDHTQ
jgi:hypothetical protein